MTEGQVGPGGAHALWLDRTTIAWPKAHHPGRAQPAFRLRGHQSAQLHHADQFTEAQLARFPHVEEHYRPLTVQLSPQAIKNYLKNALQVEGRIGNTLVVQTGVQIAGVIDDLFSGAAERQLGVTWRDGTPTLRLWAPTAWHVSLDLWVAGERRSFPASADEDGVWTVAGKPGWADAEYLWNVTVYVPSEGRIVTNRVTDPYSVGLTVDSKRSVLVDLDDPRWQPRGWNEVGAAPLRTPASETIYELHVRDFSAADQSVPSAWRGAYKAFTCADSHGMTHLRRLADAGITTVHLLPTFDFASVPEDRSLQEVPNIPEGAGPASSAQQRAVAATADADGFNWGYDPYHWSTPEGSYATEGNQTGGARTLEFREMVASLHGLGLRVVLDQVFNHTFQSGQAASSVLDKVVPRYYHRLAGDGSVETSSCCPNIATENVMAEKMLIDSVLLWAEKYRVDGFRFDLMGHHRAETLTRLRERLSELRPDEHGVDGDRVYIYGEGWNFGEVANDRLFTQARQGNLAGSGIGSFNDRLRDAVRGGSPMDFEYARNQGYATGLAGDPNASSSGMDEGERLARLRYYTDLIRLGLGGNLVDFRGGHGQNLDKTDFNGHLAAFAEEPEENVNYVDAHDDLTLFDLGAFKLPQDMPMDERVRMNTLALATVLLGQSPAFLHAGTEILRSKSLDRNSFNSGDHFNAVDWTLATTNFGGGLPVFAENGPRWEQMAPILADAAVKPDQQAMSAALQMTLDLLRIRSQTALITLGSADRIRRAVAFPLVDAGASPGLLLMLVDDTDGVDQQYRSALIAFNASGSEHSHVLPELEGREFSLHPVQEAGFDPVVRRTRWEKDTGLVTVPGRSVAVLVEPRM